MIRFRRRNTSWLVMMGLLIALALLSETTMALHCKPSSSLATWL